MLEKRIMTMNVLINAQRAKTELSTYFNTVGDMTNHFTIAEFKDIKNAYGQFDKIIKELSDELEL